MRKSYLKFSFPHITQVEIDAVVRTLKSGWLTSGEQAGLFEEGMAAYTQARHAVAVSSGTAALFLSLLVEGVQPGDEVITTPFTFISTANVIHHLGAKPVFVDIEEDTYNIDPEQIERAVSPKTRAILPVHYSGQPCDMRRIMAIARRHKLRVVEDAAHALGAEYSGKMVGGLGNLTCFSLFPTKNITTGEGGVITLNNSHKAQRLRRLRLHGMSKDGWKRYKKEGSWYYEIHEPGYKYNLSDINAALGVAQLGQIEALNDRRTRLALSYQKKLGRIPGIKTLALKPGIKSSWHIFPIHVDADVLGIDRNRLVKELYLRNIGTSVHFIPCHLQPFYQEQYGYRRGDFPMTERVYSGIVSLPLFPGMVQNDINDVVAAIQDSIP